MDSILFKNLLSLFAKKMQFLAICGSRRDIAIFRLAFYMTERKLNCELVNSDVIANYANQISADLGIDANKLIKLFDNEMLEFDQILDMFSALNPYFNLVTQSIEG